MLPSHLTYLHSLGDILEQLRPCSITVAVKCLSGRTFQSIRVLVFILSPIFTSYALKSASANAAFHRTIQQRVGSVQKHEGTTINDSMNPTYECLLCSRAIHLFSIFNSIPNFTGNNIESRTMHPATVVCSGILGGVAVEKIQMEPRCMNGAGCKCLVDNGMVLACINGTAQELVS
jgi:hypothetical protein